MSVSAVGNRVFIPEDSFHANTLQTELLQQDGWFSPDFTCFGEEVDFTGPGVGIISTVPGNRLQAYDGTSMACPHIAGLAALLLAHEPSLSDLPRNSRRVDEVYRQLRRQTRKFALPRSRTGAGMPFHAIPA